MLFQDEPVDFVEYSGSNQARCGYCGQKDTSHTFGVWAHSLTVRGYKKLVDRGWRRSGCYLYKPNLVQSCCQLYTIKLDAHAFKPNKQQRAALRKFDGFVLGSGQTGKTIEEYIASTDASSRFSADLEPPQFTDEKFALYKKYQLAIHNDKESELKPSSFKRFLCDTPLEGQDKFGSFHQMYRLDGKLIAVAVLDLLPGCISSVYFLYDPNYRHLSLGRVSACREAILSKAEPFGEYYMGYFIPDCVKMKYKGEYAPSFLKDPASTTWYPLERFMAIFKQDKTLVSFDATLDRVHNSYNNVWESKMPDVISRTQAIDALQGNYNVLIYEDGGVVPVAMSSLRKNKAKLDKLIEMLAAMGSEMFGQTTILAAV